MLIDISGAHGIMLERMLSYVEIHHSHFIPNIIPQAPKMLA